MPTIKIRPLKNPLPKLSNFSNLMRKISTYLLSLAEDIVLKQENRSAYTWFNDQTPKKQQKILAILFTRADLANSAIKKNTSPDGLIKYTIQETDLINFGRYDTEQKLPTAGEIKDLKITQYDEDFNNLGQLTITVKNKPSADNTDRYYRLLNIGTDHEEEIELVFPGEAVNIVSSFEQTLNNIYATYLQETSLDEAIEHRDFKIIINNIQHEYFITDEQLTKLFNLSAVIKTPTLNLTPTFLHFLLHPISGIKDQEIIKKLLLRAKNLLPDFDFKQLFNLSDGMNTPKEWCTSDLRILLDLSSTDHNIHSDIDTHQLSIHASTDFSLVRLYKALLIKHKDFEPDAETIARSGIIQSDNTFVKSNLFLGFVKNKIIELHNVINTWLSFSDDALQAQLTLAQNTESLIDIRFKLNTAERLLTACQTEDGVMSCRSDSGATITIYFNANNSCGLTIKEILALTYDAISDANDPNLTLPTEENQKKSTLLSYFIHFISHLYQIKREYNYGNKYGDDLHKCPGGTINHLAYSLVGVYNTDIIDIPYITHNDKKKFALEAINTCLLKKLQTAIDSVIDEDKKILFTGIMRCKFGSQLNAVFNADFIKQLTMQLEEMFFQEYKKYFHPGNYHLIKIGDRQINFIENALNSTRLNNLTHPALDNIKYSDLLTADEFITQMEQRTIPLYTATSIGYRYTMEVMQEKDREFARSIMEHLLQDIKSQKDIMDGHDLANLSNIKRPYQLIAAYHIHDNFFDEELVAKLHFIYNEGDVDSSIIVFYFAIQYFIVSKNMAKLEVLKELLDSTTMQKIIHRFFEGPFPDLHGLYFYSLENFQLLEILDPDIIAKQSLLRTEELLTDAIRHIYDEKLYLYILQKAPNIFNLTSELIFNIDSENIERIKRIIFRITNIASHDFLSTFIDMITAANQDKNLLDQILINILLVPLKEINRSNVEFLALKLIHIISKENFMLTPEQHRRAFSDAILYQPPSVILALIAKVNPQSLSHRHLMMLIKKPCEQKEILWQKSALLMIDNMSNTQLSMEYERHDNVLRTALECRNLMIAKKIILKLTASNLIALDALRTAIHNIALLPDKIIFHIMKKVGHEYFMGIVHTILPAAITENRQAIVLHVIKFMTSDDLATIIMSTMTPTIYHHNALTFAIFKNSISSAIHIINALTPEQLAISQDTEYASPLLMSISMLQPFTPLNINKITAQLISKMRKEDLSICDKNGNTYLMLLLSKLITKQGTLIALQLIKKMTKGALALRNKNNKNALEILLSSVCPDVPLNIHAHLIVRKLIKKMHFSALKPQSNIDVFGFAVINYKNITNGEIIHDPTAAAENAAVLHLLLNKIAAKDLNQPDKFGVTPLLTLTKLLRFRSEHTVKLVSALIKKLDPANLSYHNKLAGEKSAVSLIFEHRDIDLSLPLIIRLHKQAFSLWNHGYDYSNKTAWLFWAIISHHTDIALFLIPHIDVNMLTEALIIAQECRDYKIIFSLLSRGATDHNHALTSTLFAFLQDHNKVPDKIDNFLYQYNLHLILTAKQEVFHELNANSNNLLMATIVKYPEIAKTTKKYFFDHLLKNLFAAMTTENFALTNTHNGHNAFTYALNILNNDTEKDFFGDEQNPLNYMFNIANTTLEKMSANSQLETLNYLISNNFIFSSRSILLGMKLIENIVTASLQINTENIFIILKAYIELTATKDHLPNHHLMVLKILDLIENKEALVGAMLSLAVGVNNTKIIELLLNNQYTAISQSNLLAAFYNTLISLKLRISIIFLEKFSEHDLTAVEPINKRYMLKLVLHDKNISLAIKLINCMAPDDLITNDCQFEFNNNMLLHTNLVFSYADRHALHVNNVPKHLKIYLALIEKLTSYQLGLTRYNNSYMSSDNNKDTALIWAIKNQLYYIVPLIAEKMLPQDLAKRDIDNNLALHLLIKDIKSFLSDRVHYATFFKTRLGENILTAIKVLIKRMNHADLHLPTSGQETLFSFILRLQDKFIFNLSTKQTLDSILDILINRTNSEDLHSCITDKANTILTYTIDHNYFTVAEKIIIKINPAKLAQKPTAGYAALDILFFYLSNILFSSKSNKLISAYVDILEVRIRLPIKINLMLLLLQKMSSKDLLQAAHTHNIVNTRFLARKIITLFFIIPKLLYNVTLFFIKLCIHPVNNFRYFKLFLPDTLPINYLQSSLKLTKDLLLNVDIARDNKEKLEIIKATLENHTLLYGDENNNQPHLVIKKLISKNFFTQIYNLTATACIFIGCKLSRKYALYIKSCQESRDLATKTYLNSKDYYGVTNFSKIIKHGDEKLVEAALNLGADIYLPSNGRTPREVAILIKNFNILHLLNGRIQSDSDIPHPARR